MVLSATHTPARAQAPLIDITSPEGRIASSGPVRIVAQLRASDDESVLDVDGVRFYVDDTLVGEDTEGPIYAAQWADKNPFAPVTIRAEAIRSGVVVSTDTTKLPGLEITDESRIASVLMDVSVLDEQGRYVRELTRANFTVFEDGKAQTIELMDAALVPTTHTLLVDTSNSMSYRFDFVRRAARRLGSTMRPNDHMVVLPFSATLGPMTGPTTDLITVASAVDFMQSRGGTAISDAVIAASQRLEPLEGRHVMVLITDGYDEHSDAKFDEAMEAVKKLHGTLYTVGINGAAGISIRGRAALKRLAEGTGGKAFFPSRDEELPVVHDRVASDVASRYLLTYTPTNQERDGLWRKVDIATGNPKLTIKTRDGYFAAAPPPIKPTLEFVARDLNRRPVAITRGDLVVIEDGIEQEISSFQESVDPVSIVMALDKSGSMRGQEESVKAAAAAFIDALRPEDRLGVVGFSNGAEGLADIAPYRTWSRHAVNQYRTSGGTALYDGIGLALERLEGIKGRRAIVVMTDGKDENAAGNGPGSQLTFTEIIGRLAQTDVEIYAIGLGKGVDRQTLEHLAKITNGEAYFPSDVSQLVTDYRRVTEDIRRRYVLGWTSTNSRRDGKWRTVELRTKTNGLVLASRGGYEAPSR